MEFTLVPKQHGIGSGVVVSAAYVAKHDPQVGGYYVLYPDGYESWSPAEAFRAGLHAGGLVTIPRFDVFDFRFNNGRGIRADQIDRAHGGGGDGDPGVRGDFDGASLQ